jgi:hypothetical protein
MRFIIGFLVTIGLLIFVFVLIFRGGGSDSAAPAGRKLLDYANSSTVAMQYTQEGPVEADQTHDEVRITVGSTQTTIEVFQGYEGNIIRSKTYPNNSAAYADFLRGLQLLGYNNGSTDKALADERGFCPAGSRYVFAIKDGSSDVQRFWTSTCGGGSFKGKGTNVRNLFLRQVPDYTAQTANIF